MTEEVQGTLEVLVTGRYGTSALVSYETEEGDKAYVIQGAPLSREDLVLLAQGIIQDFSMDEERDFF